MVVVAWIDGLQLLRVLMGAMVPRVGLRGLFGGRFLVRQAVAAAAKRGVSDVVLGLIRKGSRHGELDAAHAGAH